MSRFKIGRLTQNPHHERGQILLESFCMCLVFIAMLIAAGYIMNGARNVLNQPKRPPLTGLDTKASK